MEKMIGRCGIICSDCGAFIATQTGNEELRAKTAKEWSELYHADIKTEDVYCDGCMQNEGHLFAHCHECEIRKCAQEKDAENCGYCTEYSCKKLDDFLKYLPPTTKELLDEIHNNQ